MTIPAATITSLRQTALSGYISLMVIVIECRNNMQEFIDQLGLIPHLEGGYYRQVYKADDNFNDHRKLYTSIYFLLTADNPSRFHRLTADEIWFSHAGQALTVHMIDPDGIYTTAQLGHDLVAGQVLQYCVPKGTIFGSTVEEPGGFALVSCMVAPGFEYEDLQLFDRADLLATYPDHATIITRLTKGD